MSILLLAAACTPGKEELPAPVLTPGQVVLLFPDKDAACTVTTVVSDTTSNVTFRWRQAANTDAYQLNVKDLITGMNTTQILKDIALTVLIKRNHAFSCSVTATADKTTETSTSEVWRFFTPGLAGSTFAPFPAEVVRPLMNAVVTAVDGNAVLEWTGSDSDHDITGYDVYVSDSPSPLLYKENVSDRTLVSIPVVSGHKYYWKVITKDAAGNSSNNGVFQFSIP